jgi:hypothetical protein
MGNRLIRHLKRVTALMGDARLDAPPQLVSKFQDALRRGRGGGQTLQPGRGPASRRLGR